MNNIYFKVIINEIPRLLGLLDRNPASPTFGCFDRNFWHYNVTDFPCARFQEAVLTLAYLYLLEHKDNPYYNSKNFLDWINAGIEFWSSIQRKNGSFDEWYPFESSFVATAFTSYAISEVLLLLGNNIKIYNKILENLERAIRFLCKDVDYTACNQEAGAILAIYNFYLLSSDKRFEKVAYERLKKLSKLQNEEGWFPEYGGPDVGYLSLTIDYLCKLYDKSKHELAKDMVDRAIEFLAYFVHPDGTFGGEYGSRNTKYLIPSGIELASSWNSNARFIADALRKALEDGKTVGPYNLDERYLAYIGYTYLQAALLYKDHLEEKEQKKKFDKLFVNCGIWVYSNDSLYVVSNFNKGGVLRIVFKNNNSFIDSGVVVKIGKNYFSPCWLSPKREIEIDRSCFRIERYAVKIPSFRMSILKNILLRVFQITFGRMRWIGKLIKRFFRERLISKQKIGNVKVERIIRFVKDKIEIEDRIESSKTLEKVYIGIENPYIFIPSSRYFQIADLNKYGHEIIANSKRIVIWRVFDEEGKEKLTYKLY